LKVLGIVDFDQMKSRKAYRLLGSPEKQTLPVRHCSYYRKASEGIAMVEFVMAAAPVALIIFFLIADFGRLMRLADELAFSARAGVEYAYQTWSFGGGNLTSADASTIRDIARCAIRNSLDECKYTSATVTVSKICNVCPSGTTLNPAGSGCSTIDVLGSAVRCTGYGIPQIIYTVTISAPFVPETPLISSIVGNSLVITRSATHRVQ
jgi:hypothetical protein